MNQINPSGDSFAQDDPRIQTSLVINWAVSLTVSSEGGTGLWITQEIPWQGDWEEEGLGGGKTLFKGGGDNNIVGQVRNIPITQRR